MKKYMKKLKNMFFKQERRSVFQKLEKQYFEIF